MAVEPRESATSNTQRQFCGLHTCATEDPEHVKLPCQQELKWEEFRVYPTTC